jgi:hypothetical protein
MPNGAVLRCLQSSEHGHEHATDRDRGDAQSVQVTARAECHEGTVPLQVVDGRLITSAPSAGPAQVPLAMSVATMEALARTEDLGFELSAVENISASSLTGHRGSSTASSCAPSRAAHPDPSNCAR